MKLLLENWRKYITEDAKFFGKSFEQFKQRTDNGEHPVKVADEILKKIGKGSTRFAYALPDNPNYVVKTINVELDPWSDNPKGKEFYDPQYVNPRTGFNRKQKIDSNEWEANLVMQQKYPGVFPRSFEVADDYSWILVEKVTPVNLRKMLEVLNLPLHYDKNEMRTVIRNVIELFEDKFVKKTYNPIDNYLGNLSEDLGDERTVTYAAKPEISRVPPHIMDVKRVLEKPENRQLFLAAAELNIPPREFLPKNMGLSTIGGEHLVLLDASLWQEPKKGNQI